MQDQTRGKKAPLALTRRTELLALLALAVLAAYLHFNNIGGNMGLKYRVDDGYYSTAAKLVHEGMTPYRDFVFTHVPLYLYVLSAAYTLLGESIATARVVTAAIAILTGFLLYAVVRRLYNPLSALLAFGAYMLNPAVLLTDRVTQLSTPVLLFVMAAIYCFLRSTRNSHVALAGALLGIGFLVKEPSLLALAGISAFLLWEKKREKIWYLLGGFGIGASPFAYLYYLYPTQIANYALYHLIRPPATLHERIKTLSLLAADPVVLALGFAGLFVALRRKNASDKLVVSLFATSFLTIFSSGFWFHYIPQQMLMLAALASTGATYASTELAGRLKARPYTLLLAFAMLSLAFVLPKDHAIMSQTSDLLPRIAQRVAEISGSGDYVLTYYPAIAFLADRQLAGELYEVGEHYSDFTDSGKIISIADAKRIRVIVVSNAFFEKGRLREFMDFVRTRYRSDRNYYDKESGNNITLYVRQ